MAFIYCVNCDYTQDDFYEWPRYNKYLKKIQWGYNPVTKFITAVRWLAKPHIINFDGGSITGWHYHKNHEKPEYNHRAYVFSWLMLGNRIKNIIYSMRRMKYRTYKSYKKARKNNNATCPECGKSNWEID